MVAGGKEATSAAGLAAKAPVAAGRGAAKQRPDAKIKYHRFAYPCRCWHRSERREQHARSSSRSRQPKAVQH